MSTSKLNEWLQVVGLFGVIASLIFVGLQMKQDREVAILAAYQARADTTVEMTLAMATDPVLRSAYLKRTERDPPLLTADEGMALFGHFTALLYSFENIHFQYETGFLPEDHGQKTRALLKRFLAGDSFRDLYFRAPDTWRASFGEMIEDTRRRN